MIATASAGGNRVDEAILGEIEGTANMVLRLDRSLAERRVTPAIDVAASGTSHDDVLLGVDGSARRQALRRAVLDAAESGPEGPSAVEVLLSRIAATRTNDELLAQVTTTSKGSGRRS